MPRLNVVIRPASKADLPAIIALEQATFTSHAISRRQMRFLQQSANAIFLVAKSGEAVAGDAVALIRHHAGGRISGRIYSLVVDANFRGQKIGQKLMSALMKALEHRRVARVYLEVEDSNEGAIRLYQQLGFEIIKPLHHYYGRGKHGVHMRYENSKPRN